MDSLLASVANFVSISHELYINGGAVPSSGDARLPIYDPSTGMQIASTVDATAQDVDRAVTSAFNSFRSGVWKDMRPAERERILLRLADLVERDAEILAQLETLEQGKSLAISRALEAGGAQTWIRYVAGLATTITGKTFDVSIPFPPDARYTSYTRRTPIGVVAGIIPWNFPLLIGVWKVLPALAAGCSVVAKPAETTPLTLLYLARLATEAGVPDGVFNVVTGRGTVAGSQLVNHPLVSKISFTGSTPVGKAIARSCADSLKRFSLELGGKNPAIVLDDADLEQTVQGLMLASFLNQGQVCAACSRIYVTDKMFDPLRNALTQAIQNMTVGAGMNLQAQINPVVSAVQQKKILSYVQNADTEAEQVIIGQNGPNAEGYYVPPTLIINPSPEATCVTEEIFGPVLTLTRTSDANEALQLANTSSFGLAASVWTQNLQAAMTLPAQLEAGTVWVNSHVMIDPNMPFGGLKQSGSGTDFGSDWLDSFTIQKSICIRH
ncbi:aldehyde dehydrogenase family protein [Acetobacter ascendens]|uniref:NAD-dependent phenylacetaldehyde dehydrogenase n=1 Tax=Acetobacter ascendens TaxID=481146 RepID=A0A1D8QX92_9PROT|nr:aldehyde dehydrogenase family protein [Acetobacter ascendens]AOW46946.1 NAD-dependent phenylacetaldehyde dehydrogenase [Acetobacter ascendens]AOW49056.1 NAD-dependent phenylacetaldehyde dehydrogenase [Acetobacter ascendens]